MSILYTAKKQLQLKMRALPSAILPQIGEGLKIRQREIKYKTWSHRRGTVRFWSVLICSDLFGSVRFCSVLMVAVHCCFSSLFLCLCVVLRYNRYHYKSLSSKSLGNSPSNMQQYVFIYRWDAAPPSTHRHTCTHLETPVHTWTHLYTPGHTCTHLDTPAQSLSLVSWMKRHQKHFCIILHSPEQLKKNKPETRQLVFEVSVTSFLISFWFCDLD